MTDPKDEKLAVLLRLGLSDQEHCENLREVKNYIAGHELRKRQYVREGLIRGLTAIVEQTDTQTSRNSRLDLELNGTWTQVANIVCVLAHGGPTYVHLILQSPLLAGLVARLSAGSHTKQSLVILNALNAIADNLPLSAPNTWNVDRSLAEYLYARKTRIDFVRLLSPGPNNDVSEQIFEATAALICKTCTTSRYKTFMVEGGTLAVLCRRLVSFVVKQGLVVPGQTSRQTEHMDKDFVFVPATSYGQLSATLETIATLIESSKQHSLRFLCDPSMLRALPRDAVSTSISDSQEVQWNAQGSAPLSTPLDLFLPTVPNNESGDPMERSSFPPLGTALPTTKRRLSSIRPTTSPSTIVPMDDTPEEESEYLTIPWLLYIVRMRQGKHRLVACRLLAILRAHDLVRPARTRTFGTLLIPVLIQMLDDQMFGITNTPFLLTNMHYSQAVPAVLSSLIQDDSEMQRIAFEAKAIPRLAIALKGTFEQADTPKAELWIPNKTCNIPSQPTSSATDTPGLGGPLLDARHLMTFREGLLRALAAIAPSDDTYRKEICDQGALVQIMLALEPFQYQSSNGLQSQDVPTLSSGNSTSTLLAACNAVRALTRSVTALRTKLVDADVGKAIIKLMYNSDPEVRIAATKVIANLAMDFSPLKATISEPDLVKKLCEQAHSANARLRLESVWALKLLVLNAPNKLKRDVIDELGSNWIKHLIETDPYDIPPGVVIGLSERDYPPRAVHDNDDDISDDIVMDEDLKIDLSSQSDFAESYNKHTVEDDLAIQEQLIDLIRNLFCGKAASEIVDYLLGEIGTDTFIKVLIDRLRPRLATTGARHIATKGSPYRGIIVKVLYVIVHIAACAPKFRNMISANSTLMRSIAGFCNHEDSEIRVQCCWIIINLTFEDDSTDREACRMRALEIQKAGFQGHMRRLESDIEPNVRERAKTAVHLLLKMM